MKKAIMATKIGMTQIFDDNANLIPVTVLEAGPCVVVQKKTMENDGYEAIQVGYVDAKDKHTNSPKQGHFKKSDVPFKRHLKEFRLDDISAYEVGQEITADVFEAGDKIDVTGISKGKGYQGVVKKYNHATGPKSHGSRHHRTPGARAGASDPGKVFKGMPLASHMGAEKITVQNLEVVRVDKDKNLILVKGAVPGPRKSVLTIKDSVKA